MIMSPVLIMLFLSRTASCFHVDTSIQETDTKEDFDVLQSSRDEENSDDSIDDFMFIEEELNDNTEHELSKRSISSNVAAVYPEILVVVDYTLVKKFGYSKTKTRKYVVNFMSAVNLRYKSVNAPKIELKIADILVSTSKQDTPFIFNNILSSNSFDASTSLQDAGSYYYGKTYPRVVFDIVLVLTGEEMCRFKTRGSKKCHPSTAGYAYVAGACKVNDHKKKISSVTIVEDDGGYSGVVVAAHEIGHLLGASHDGQYSPSYVGGPGARSCSTNDGFIMSDNRRTERGLQWSSCSIAQFKHYLATPSASCLYNTPVNEKYPLLTHDQLSKRVASADDQCKMEAGSDSKACFPNGDICTQLFCKNSKTNGCVSYRPAVEGTACGTSNGFCTNGKCLKTTYSFLTSIKKKSSIAPSTSYGKSSKIVKPSKITTTQPKSTRRTTLTPWQSSNLSSPWKSTSSSPWTSKTSSKTTTSPWTSTTRRVTTPWSSTRKITTTPWSSTTRRQTTTPRKSSNTNSRLLTSPTPRVLFMSKVDNEVCVDRAGTVGHGLTCSQLLRRYSFSYCKNKSLQKKCCYSHQQFC